ncbi:glycosyltransferase family 4 protein [Cellulosimicrobium sp. PMB13]|uniref:glycosyltransferase family 4 protein n=1 Tax=Cellulosimicrobium sp. PMB13 TaxID=3120158 RepID=UPI003F4C71CA
MRIALVTTSVAPEGSGLGGHVFAVAQHLVRAGCEVVVWVAARRNDEQDAPEGVVVRYLPSPLPERGAREVAAFVAASVMASSRWIRAMRIDRPDVVHVHGFAENGVWALLWTSLLRRRLVVTSHGETLGDLDEVFRSSMIFRHSLRRAMVRASAVTAPSRYVLDDLEGRFGLVAGAGHVVPNGSQAVSERTDPPVWAPQRFVLAVGRLVDVKGFDLLLDAFACADLPSEIQLVIVGDGPERESLEKAVASHGLTDRVHLPGRLSRLEVDSLMHAARALVVPSRSDAFPLVLLEGWRSGSAVIVTVHGGAAEIVEDGVDALLVDPFDIAALVSAMRAMVLDNEHHARVSAGGSRAVRRFSWNVVAHRYEAIYRQ